MATQNVRLPIVTIERVSPFFCVALGLREAHAFGAMVVQRTSRVSPSGTEITGPVKSVDLGLDHPVIRLGIM